MLSFLVCDATEDNVTEMTNFNTLQKELKLRQLFTELIKKKGYENEFFGADLLSFFGLKQEITLIKIKNLWVKHISERRHLNDPCYLYFHIPFCRRKCRYCFFQKDFYVSESQMTNYVQFIIQETQSFKDLFKDVQFQSLYFGGGTPNLLTRKQLEGLLKEINGSFSFDERAERTFECNPYDFSLDKMRVLADFGINRLSFGIQSLDEKVLRHANRGYQNYDMIKKNVRNIRKFPNLERINADLLIGLWNDTPQTIAESFIKLSELQFDSITLYPLKPIFCYLKAYFNNDKVLFNQQVADKLRRFEELIIPIAREFDYDFIPLNHSTIDKFEWSFVLKDSPCSGKRRIPYETDDVPYNCLGIGKGCWSRIAQTIYYRDEGSLSAFREHRNIENNYFAFSLKGRREKFRYIFDRLPDQDRILVPLYKKWFGTDIREDFREEFDKLTKLGAITITGEVISLRAMDPDDKFAYLLFFVDNQTILAEFDKLHSKSHALHNRCEAGLSKPCQI